MGAISHIKYSYPYNISKYTTSIPLIIENKTVLPSQLLFYDCTSDLLL